jgi:hypothetical protein
MVLKSVSSSSRNGGFESLGDETAVSRNCRTWFLGTIYRQRHQGDIHNTFWVLENQINCLEESQRAMYIMMDLQ